MLGVLAVAIYYATHKGTSPVAVRAMQEPETQRLAGHSDLGNHSATEEPEPLALPGGLTMQPWA